MSSSNIYGLRTIFAENEEYKDANEEMVPPVEEGNWWEASQESLFSNSKQPQVLSPAVPASLYPNVIVEQHYEDISDAADEGEEEKDDQEELNFRWVIDGLMEDYEYCSVIVVSFIYLLATLFPNLLLHQKSTTPHIIFAFSAFGTL